MIRRLRYILLSYATRPMVWTLAAIYLFLLGATIDGVRKLSTRENRSRQEAYPGTSTWGRTLSLGDAKSIEDFERGRLQSSTATVTISCNSNDLKETAKLLQLLKANPKLRTLTLHSCKFQHDDEGRALAELTQLQFVSLQNCVVPSSLWKQLGQLPELRKSSTRLAMRPATWR